MLARVQLAKWGNSQAVRIPKALLEEARLQEGDELEIRLREGRITIEPVKEKLTLESLVARITPDNQHGEQDWGPPAGREVW